MVSAFDAWVADLGIPLLAEFHGDPVGVDHYYPDGTYNGSYKAIVGDEHNEEIPTADGQGWRRARTVTFFRQEGLPFWDANAAVGYFVYDAIQYAFDIVESIRPTMAVVKLIRVAATEQRHVKPHK